MLEVLEIVLNRDIEPVAAPEQSLVEAIRRHYGEPDTAGPEPNLGVCFSLASPFDLDEVDLGSWETDSRAARLLNRFVATAISRNAREVRIGPGDDRIRLRYTGDDGAAEREVSPPQLLRPIITRIRIMAGIWVGDQRAEQVGTFQWTVRGKQFDVGVLIRRLDAGPEVVLTFRPADSDLGSE